MVAFNKIYEGQILYDRHITRQGNTTSSTMGEWEVKVKQLDMETRRALCSWNNNPPTWYSEQRLKKLHLKSNKDAK